MAACSGGVDWATFMKPFLLANSEISNKTELLDLCNAIIKRYWKGLRALSPFMLLMY